MRQTNAESSPAPNSFTFNVLCLSSNYAKDRHYYCYTVTLHTKKHPQIDISEGPRYVICKVLSPEPTKSKIKKKVQPYNIFLGSLLFFKKAMFKTSMVITCSIKKHVVKKN